MMDQIPSPYFDAAPCYLTVLGRDFKILHANQRFREDFGEFENRCCYQVYKRRSEKCEVCPVERAFWDGQSHRNEGRVTRLDGTEVSILVEATPLRDDAGNITAVIDMATDITQIKRIERQMRSSQRRYHLLFDEVPCYISIQDSDLNIVETNRAFQEDFGNCLGRKCYEAYKHRAEPCIPCTVQETFEDGEPHTREEAVTSLDGRTINMLVTTAPIHNGQGEITGVMEMSTNITLIRDLEDRLTQLGLLIGSVSHGLKGLLNGLAGGMYLVNTGFKKNDEGRVHKGWATVERNVSRIKSMVSDILYYAKDREPNWEPLSAVTVVEEVCGLAETRAQEHGVELVKICDADAGEFEADAQAIRSMLTNLVENSVDACRVEDSGTVHRVEVTLRGESEVVRIEVKDNGIGMDQETREKAFSLFFSSKGTGGTGLGLFVADRIAKAHGGSIKLESQLGIGSRFVVTLPRWRPVPSAQADEPEDERLSDLERFHE